MYEFLIVVSIYIYKLIELQSTICSICCSMVKVDNWEIKDIDSNKYKHILFK